MNRAHHSIAQHRGDAHHLIEHHTHIHKFKNKKITQKHKTQNGGGKHRGNLNSDMILKRTTNSIRDFYNTTKKLRR